MEKLQTINVYLESENVSIRLVSNPAIADLVINEAGIITSTVPSNKKSINDIVIFKEETKVSKDILPQYAHVNSNQLEIDISNLLKNLGILPNIKGYRYTIEAVKILIKDPKAINSVIKGLYTTVAEIFNTSPSKTERAIRHSIELAFSRGDVELLNKLFILPLSSGKSKPTNSEFLSCIAEHFRFDQKNIK